MKKYFVSLYLFVLMTTTCWSSSQELPDYSHLRKITCPIQPRHRHLSPPHMSIRESASLNWSGYAAATSLTHPSTGSVSHVHGTWKVPTLSSSREDAYCGTWVGMDGYSDTTVEQIGTEQDWISGGQQNYAWFEMYPNPAFELVGFPVNTGDHIGASVSYEGHSLFKLVIVNYSAGVFTIVPKEYTTALALRNSANWIVEAPSSGDTLLPLANFGTVKFKKCTAKIKGKRRPIGHWKHDRIKMESQRGTLKAKPSRLGNRGSSFCVNRIPRRSFESGAK